MATIEKITESILKEARRRWRIGSNADKLAPSLAISMLSDSKWYASLVRWPNRGRKIVERNSTGASLIAVLKAIADGFVPVSVAATLPTDKPRIEDESCNCDGAGCSICTGIPGFDGYGSGF